MSTVRRRLDKLERELGGSSSELCQCPNAKPIMLVRYMNDETKPESPALPSGRPLSDDELRASVPPDERTCPFCGRPREVLRVNVVYVSKSQGT